MTKTTVKMVLIIGLLAVLIVSVAGCTSSNSPTAQPTTQATAAPATSVDMTAKLDNAFTSQNYTLVKPFTRTVSQYGNVVYTGVVKDGENKLVPYVRNMTLEETKNRSDSLTRFDAYVAQALAQGYPEQINQTGFWYGSSGGPNPANAVTVRINQPNSGISFNDYLGVFETNYTVTSEYMTKA
jgi:hypothetical protein